MFRGSNDMVFKQRLGSKFTRNTQKPIPRMPGAWMVLNIMNSISPRDKPKMLTMITTQSVGSVSLRGSRNVT